MGGKRPGRVVVQSNKKRNTADRASSLQHKAQKTTLKASSLVLVSITGTNSKTRATSLIPLIKAMIAD